MSNTVNTFLNSPITDSHVLFGLLFCLNYEDNTKIYDPETPINQIDENLLILAVSLLEHIIGVNTPDEYLLENKNKSLRDLALEIQALPRLTDAQFAEKLKETILVSQKVANNNFS